MRRALVLLVFFAIAPMTRAFAAETARVVVESGPLIGTLERGLQVFKGIPYAKPPVGPLRFRAPELPASWKDARDAQAFGPACPQARPVETMSGDASQSEDCLTLNVWAPAKVADSTAPSPVMVWIHGGGNTAGASSRRYYDGSSFARDGIVLVSINYRLGRLGFFAHPALTKAAKPGEALANYALLDQIAALAWVQRNAAAFGGDAKNVTVFGESAGGEDVLALMTAKGAQGLFHHAIVESGGGWRPTPTLMQAEESGSRFAATLLTARDAKITVEALRGLSATDLTKDEEDIGPIVDGRLLASPVTRAFAEGHAASIPLMIGTNSDEGSLVALAPATGMLKQFSEDELTRARALYGAEVDDTLLARLLFRDLNFTAPARWIARRVSGSAPVFLYRFTHLRRSQRGRVPGASHGAELPYVFDSWRQSPNGGVLAPEDLAFAATLHACWVSFAKSGVPVCGSTTARPYSEEKDAIIEFGTEVSEKPDPLRPILDFVDARVRR